MQQSLKELNQLLNKIKRQVNVLRSGSLVFFAIVVLLSSCRKEDTSWNSDWTAPVVNDTLSLNNLVNDSTLFVNSLSNLEVDLTRTILDIGISDIVGIGDTVIKHSFTSAVPVLSVPPGFSIVNEIEEHTINVEDLQLKKIRVNSGIIKMRVYNPLSTKAFFTVQLPGVTRNGIEFSENYVSPAGSMSSPSTVDAILDISGYEIDLTGMDGSSFNILQSKLLVNSDPAGPTITVLNSHVFKVEAEFKDIKIDYARGYFGNKIVADTITKQIDFLSNLSSGSIDFPTSSIQFDIINGMKVDAKATVTLVSNTNYTGNTVSLTGANINSPVYLDPATGNWSSLISSTEAIQFNGTNSNVESYLENLGKSHTIGYKVQLNPWGNTSGGWNEIFPNSRLKVRLKAQMPLSIGADGLTLKDTFDLDIEQNDTKTHVESGMFVLKATNSFPFSCGVTLYLMDSGGNMLHTVTGTEVIQSSAYGTVDPVDGLKKGDSEIQFVLTNAVLTDLNKIKKVAVQATFNTPDPANGNAVQVTIPAGAFLAVKLKAKLNIKAIYN
jgi:hypothetical protein